MSSSSVAGGGPSSSPTATPTTGADTDLKVQLFTSAVLVFNVNIVIYALFGLAVVLRIPHLIGLFGTSAEWYNGHFFRSTGGRGDDRSCKSRARAWAMQRNDSARTMVGDAATDKDVTDMAPAKEPNSHYYPPAGAPLPRPQQRPGLQQGQRYHLSANDQGGPRFPPRVPAVPAFLRPLLALCRARGVVPGYSMGQLVVLVVYFFILVYALMYRSNPFTDATRPAWVAVSQVPLVLVLAGKGGNVMGGLLGYGYERLNYIHRFAGKMVVLGCNLHGVYYLYKWSLAGTFTQNIVSPKNAWGMAMLVAVNVLWVFSTSFWRQKAYNVFIWSHTMAVLVVLPAIYMHQHTLWSYALASGSVYALDRLLRLSKTRITTAILTPQPNSTDTVLVEVPSLNAGWRAGQHVRLRVLEGRGIGMGLFGWGEVHPFTIASVGYNDRGVGGEGLVLAVKRVGGWTGRLVKLGASKRNRLRQRQFQIERQRRGGDVVDLGNEEKSMGDIGVRVRVWLEGPYGGCGRMVFASFSATIIICGGSGISFGMSILHDLAQKDAVGESRLKYIELIWVVQDAASADGFLPELLDLVESFDRESSGGRGRGRRYTGAQVKVGVWFTRALTDKLGVFDEEWSDVGADDAYRPVAIHPNVVLSPGRPKIGRSLDVAMGRAVSLGDEGEGRGVMGVAVGICGPKELGDEVVGVVGRVDAARRDQVGGIEVHEETFGM